MNKRFRPIAASLVLAVAVMACALPAGNGGGEPTTDQIATIVASTLQALTPVASDVATETPVPADILPYSFYYLGTDSTGLTQVFRIERDGVTLRQITFEPANVNAYDVSQVDGSVVYISNNQMLLISADGSGRRVLVDGGPVDPNRQFEESISSPVFTPDGQTIAYGHRGLNLYAVLTGVSNLVLEPELVDPGSGASGPREVYFPEKYSPDGTKLLITAAIPNSDGILGAIFYPAAGSLVRLSGENNASLCCGNPEWSLDGSALYTASSTLGMFGSGLWRVDPASGNATTLLPTEAGGGNYNLASEPYLASDGQLYFFFANAASPDGFINRAPLQLVRSTPDGVTGRTILRPDTFNLINEALWAPDASFVIVAFAPIADVYAGGQAEVTYTDGRPSVVLTTFAQEMKWGP
jgi:hypothetical protein